MSGYVILHGRNGPQYWNGTYRTFFSGSRLVSYFGDRHAATTAVRFAVRFWNARKFRSRGVRRTKASDYQIYRVRVEP